MSDTKPEALRPWEKCREHGQAQPNVWACPTCLTELRAECESLRTQLAESEQARETMRDILTRTAVAFRGPEPALTSYGWADLPERAEALRADARRWAAYRSAGSDLTLRLHNTRGDHRDTVIDAMKGE